MTLLHRSAAAVRRCFAEPATIAAVPPGRAVVAAPGLDECAGWAVFALAVVSILCVR